MKRSVEFVVMMTATGPQCFYASFWKQLFFLFFFELIIRSCGVESGYIYALHFFVLLN